MNEMQTFLDSIEAFISDTPGMTPTRFGREMAGDPRFVFQVRKGREPRRAVRERVLKNMAAHNPDPGKAAA